MEKRDRYILITLLSVVAISIFLMALRGRYQIIAIGPGYPVSHDTWTGRIYIGGTNDIYAKAQEAKENKVRKAVRDLLKESAPENK